MLELSQNCIADLDISLADTRAVNQFLLEKVFGVQRAGGPPTC